jgi:membrane glycosyltransferase
MIHLVGALVAFVWIGLIAVLNPAYLPWLAPVVLALIFAIPVTLLVQSVKAGQWTRDAGLFVTPEEVDAPAELRSFERALEERNAANVRAQDGFVSAIVDPYVNAVSVARLRDTARCYNKEISLTRALYAVKLLEHGPRCLNRNERFAILNDRLLLTEAHERVWTLGEEQRQSWGLQKA